MFVAYFGSKGTYTRLRMGAHRVLIIISFSFTELGLVNYYQKLNSKLTLLAEGL